MFLFVVQKDDELEYLPVDKQLAQLQHEVVMLVRTAHAQITQSHSHSQFMHAQLCCICMWWRRVAAASTVAAAAAAASSSKQQQATAAAVAVTLVIVAWGAGSAVNEMTEKR